MWWGICSLTYHKLLWHMMAFNEYWFLGHLTTPWLACTYSHFKLLWIPRWEIEIWCSNQSSHYQMQTILSVMWIVLKLMQSHNCITEIGQEILGDRQTVTHHRRMRCCSQSSFTWMEYHLIHMGVFLLHHWRWHIQHQNAKIKVCMGNIIILSPTLVTLGMFTNSSWQT